MYRNREGYPDPTVGAVMSKLMREYRQEQRALSVRPKKKKSCRRSKPLRREGVCDHGHHST